jgi:predicted DNA-binding transcriptional regulator YafY
MYDPSMRVLTVLELLQSRESISGRDLARQLEVHVRTVQRYVARLQDLGIPVESTRGPGGAYRLRAGFRLPPMMFSTEEAFALALGLDALAYLGLGEIEPATLGARAKLERVLPATTTKRVNVIRHALLLELPRWNADANTVFLMELAQATANRSCLQMTYSSRGGDATRRTVHPLGVMRHEGRWFLAAHCELRQAPRLFRVDRIRQLEVSAAIFKPPDDFDLRAFVYRHIALAPAPHQVEVWLELPPETVAARLPPAITILEPEGSGTRLRSGVSDLEEFAMLMLKLHCRIELRQPQALVDAFRRVAARALAVSSGLK